jgi:hypothetical protein
MIFKGTIGTGGTLTIAAFNALTTYNGGWTYRVVEAGTIRGAVCEIGDLVVAIIDRTGTGNVNADFTVIQNNLDGAVTGAVSSVDNEIALFNGTSGKIIKSAGKTIVTTLGADDLTVPTSKAVKDGCPAETATTIGAIVNGAAAATPNDTDLVATVDTGVIKKITWTNVKAFLKTYFDTLYEKVANKDATGGYAGLSLFKINFKNAANTFTSFLTNANTAARTYTFPDKDITVAGLVDINETTVGAAVANTKNPPIDADSLVIIDSADSNKAKKTTWLQIKTALTTVFDGLYWKQTATGDVTIAANVTAIGALKVATGMVQANAVTNAKLAQVATQTFKGRTTAATGDVEDLTIAQAKTLLGLTSLNLAQRKYRVTPTGTVNASNLIFTISDLIISGTEEVFKNGQLLAPTVDYTISYAATTTITMVVAPSNAGGFTDTLVVNYSI